MTRSSFFKGVPGRRGQTVIDLLIFVVILVVVALVWILAKKVSSDINTELSVDPDFSAEAKQIVQDTDTRMGSTFDNLFLFVIVGLWAFLIISSLFIDSNPIFFIITVILLLAAFVVGGIMSEAFSDISNDDDLSSATSQYPKMTWVMEHFLLVIMIMGFTSAIALYAKSDAS